MDIRKFLKGKDNSGRGGKGSTNPPTPRKRSQTKPIIIDDDDDDDPDEDFQPLRKSQHQPPSRRASSVKADTDDLKRDEVPAKSDSAARKRERPSTSTSTSKPTAASAAKAAGFGGASADGATTTRSAEGGSGPPTKKGRWVPRTDDPPNRGNKDLPVGAPDCLSGHVFVISGVLDSLLREECQDLVRQYGARVVSAPSKKVTHGIIGTEPGESKLAKLRTNNTPLIDEDELFRIISASRPKSQLEHAKQTKKKSDVKTDKSEPMELENYDERDMIKSVSTTKKSNGKPSKMKSTSTVPSEAKRTIDGSASLWVDKYRPKSSADIIGNAKAVKDLKQWLEGWRERFVFSDGHNKKLKDRGDMDQAAVLLAGPPGIGKTTAAQIVCHECGFEPHELNASDVRSKSGVQELAETVMVANTMTRYLKIGNGRNGKDRFPNGQVLVMDEVDGMSSGDRGGSQELIRLIKKSKVPIICIANDDSSPNMRSLANSCFKIRFRRPTASTMTKRLAEIARREGFHAIQDQVLAKLAEGCNGDVRQMINLLQTWRVSSPSLSYVQVKERLENEGKTVVQKSIFELSMSFFRPGADGSANSLMMRTENYFADADLVPLFVQENYIHAAGAQQSLEALADAAESIAEGDTCNAVVRGAQHWELMPTCAVLSALRPGCILAGGLTTQPQFPSFLGNLSKGNKWLRIIQGLEMKVRAARSTTSGSTRSFRLDYIPALTTCLASPLILNGAVGVQQVIDRLDAYYLERDPDWEEILEAGVYGKGRSPLENIAPAVKKLLTTEYNSTSHARSTVTGTRVGIKSTDGPIVSAARKAEKEAVGVVDDDINEQDEDDQEGSEVEEDIVKEFGTKKSRRASSRGRGKARGKGRASTASKSTGSSVKSRGSSSTTRSGSASRRGRGGRKK